MNKNNQAPDTSMLVYLPLSEQGGGVAGPPQPPPAPPPTQLPGRQAPPLPYGFTDNRLKVLPVFIASAIISVLYAMCFSGDGLRPQLSFTVFCLIAFTVLVKLLEALGYMRNRKSLLYGAPIAALSLMNGIFSVNAFSYVNIAVMYILFAAFILSAVSDSPIDLFGVDGAGKVCLTICGSWAVFFRIMNALFAGRKKRQNIGKAGKILLGSLLALPLMLLIGGLLTSADMVFANVMSRLIDKALNGAGKIDGFFITSVCAAFIYCTGYAWRAKTVAAKPEQPFTPARADIYVCAPFLALLNIMFLFFSVIQIAFLFTGGLLKLPGDMVYSEYAREGFFQLLTVTIINYAVIYVLITLFSGVTEKPALRAMIFTLLAFTVILIASSFYRLSLYIGIYAFTPLRLAVLTFLVMELALAAVTTLMLVRPDTPFIKYVMLTFLVFYIAANVTASGYVSAKLNVAVFMSGGTMRWLDVTSSGADGLAVMRPFLESGDYICRGNLLIRRDEPKVPEFFYGEEQTYDQIAASLRHKRVDWRNWSLIEYLGEIYSLSKST